MIYKDFPTDKDILECEDYWMCCFQNIMIVDMQIDAKRYILKDLVNKQKIYLKRIQNKISKGAELIMDIITITVCPTDEAILNCIDYETCKHDLRNDCIYADRCNDLHNEKCKIKKGE